MIRYETLILAHPEINEDAMAAIEKQFSSVAANHKGSLLSFDKWGRYRLSYPVKKHDFGSYILVRFELGDAASAQALQELRDFFQIRCSDSVLRYMNKKLSSHDSLEYIKPEAIVPAERGRSLSSGPSEEMGMRSRGGDVHAHAHERSSNEAF